MDRPTAEIYERVAVEWSTRRGPALDDLAARFRAELDDALVLDAGCGPGRSLGQLVGPVVGLDMTDSFLRLARGPGAPLVRGDLEALPLKDGCLGGLFARHSYLHLPKVRLEGALREAARALAPGGRLLATFICGSYEGRSLPDDDFPGRWFSFWESSELAAVVTSAGFEELTVHRLERPRGEADLLLRAVAPRSDATS